MPDVPSKYAQGKVARTAGLLYLAYIVIFAAASFIQGQPVISGDAAATAKAIWASQEVFRLGVSLELIATLLFLLTAWSLYVLFKTVDRNLALLFLVLNLVGVAVESVFALIHFAALSLCDGSKYMGVFREDQLQALAMLFLNLSDSGNMVTVLFYGVWLFPLGYLALESRLLPRFFGILLILDGISLMICFFQLWLLPGYQKWTYPLYPVMFVAEFGFGLWLAVKGVQDGPRSASEGRQAI